MSVLDVMLIHPGGQEKIYQALTDEFTAIEPPLWCRLIATYLRKHGHSVCIVDAEAENLGPEDVARRVEDRNPVLVAMIVFGHQPSASTQMMTSAGVTCRTIKSVNSKRPIIVAGGHVAALPERTLVEEAVDFACNGEGPLTIAALVTALKKGTIYFADIPGLVWRRDGELVNNLGAPLIMDLDADLPGGSWDLLPMDKYRAHNWQCFGDLSERRPYASIYTTLGCPYKCSFCCINAPFGKNGYRMRGARSVVDEIEFLYRNYGVKTYKIVDEMFVLNERHVAAICDELIGRGFSHELNFWAYARVDTVKPHMLAKLRQAGIRWLALGIESASKHVRDGAQKSLKQDDIVAIVRTIQAAGINVIGNFIFGLPDDTLETMQETLDLAIELNCEFSNFYSAMAYPGSPLYRTAVEQGIRLPDSWSGFSQHSYDAMPLPTFELSSAEVLRFRDDAFHKFFSNDKYLSMVERKFGLETRQHIEHMTGRRLRRKLVEELEVA